ncbi:Lrp/AsnC family transcriptional regulator [Candidatus Thorarchaeota archaeon]|jgi:DNA-binding Lrp family transcriptional regulator|nr:MAG: Lrp/AsnC family transcriptional regulator [Candidatus Thorarchaeota archaeon]
MTVTAYILLNVEMPAQPAVLEAVKAMEASKEVYMIYGAYDIIIKAEFEDNTALSSFIVDELKSLEGVMDTQTNVCATPM